MTAAFLVGDGTIYELITVVYDRTDLSDACLLNRYVYGGNVIRRS